MWLQSVQTLPDELMPAIAFPSSWTTQGHQGTHVGWPKGSIVDQEHFLHGAKANGVDGLPLQGWQRGREQRWRKTLQMPNWDGDLVTA
jgi:hypothetical protein